eukprot:CAMPEP_0201481904 /NCGR_PEP_ID=MMETSP0151_2-20130828/6170_1 /ASSEMBLY_ACC=CAM_ASM_000257 /TAXON_ID=200890 /ORGANISM="Paramoeba atlantica, Strain 621/1 / CCAP 1560/9" /LENGTH=223 /DNA_ID=CAMNT_0047864313 /DNA_START=134 /DNA_END=801 /DNA_ORIENTATION=-
MGSKKCGNCKKTVYPMDRVEIDGSFFHKTCFKCKQCGKKLSPGTYALLKGSYYCKPHFKQLFALGGNYDDGNGKEQHKARWNKSAPGNVTAILESDQEAGQLILDLKLDSPMATTSVSSIPSSSSPSVCVSKPGHNHRLLAHKKSKTKKSTAIAAGGLSPRGKGRSSPRNFNERSSSPVDLHLDIFSNLLAETKKKKEEEREEGEEKGEKGGEKREEKGEKGG